MKFVNLTGHPIVLMDPRTEKTVAIDPTVNAVGATVKARVVGKQETVGFAPTSGMVIPIVRYSERQAINVPDPEEGVIYITSGLTASVLRRADVVAPIGVTVKDGQSVARGLLTYADTTDERSQL